MSFRARCSPHRASSSPRDTQIASSVAGIIYLVKREKDEKVDKK